MISYSQNREDVVLDRILGPGPGFYVDCGAADPDRSSMTRHFYDNGWRGINIEPRAEAAAALARRRPEDVNLCVAVGATNGTVVFHVREDDPDQSAVVSGEADSSGVTVPIRTLDSILEEHAPERLDFLKIDVEGFERDVLQGLDLGRWRPRVIVIEAIKPWSTERVDHLWRDLITDRGYVEALFDGINLFFVAEEAGIEVPVPPASELDRAVTAQVDHLRRRVLELEAAADQSPRVDQLEGEVAQLSRRLAEQQAHLAALDRTAATRPALPPAVPARVQRHAPDQERWAVVGPPGEPEARLAALLATATDAVEVPVEHPGDIEWAELPPRCVLRLSWSPTRLLVSLLAEHGFRPVCLGRDPLDVLAAGGDDGERLLAMMTQWWDRPGTLRIKHDELSADPEATLRAALDTLGFS